MSILVLNAGSSTLKFSLFNGDADEVLCRGMVDWQGRKNVATLKLELASPSEDLVEHAELPNYGDAVSWICRSLDEHGFRDPIRAVGHRVVHGGTEFGEPVVIDESVNIRLQKISKLAPLHHPPVLATFQATRRELRDAKQVAVFDTTFFANLPRKSIVYPVPYDWFERYGVRRFGFHGISHSYCAKRAEQLMDRVGDPKFRLIVCHLGSGASATAIVGGQPINTTMGFTPLEGLMMGTRSGSIDPGILIHLLQEHGYDAAGLQEKLNRHSGLLGVSGVSSDFRTIEKAAANPQINGNGRAALAIEMFADRIRSTIGSFSVSMGGVDGIVFTAGIGENSSTLRAQVCKGLECLGLELDSTQNDNAVPDCDIATRDSQARILVIRTQEEQMVAQETLRVLDQSRSTIRT
ncbi:acetate/propionate family kinase [Mariniblastus fucicola]|uniref:Acetate kinase n=1 Tax=Mariniblastus fucicola TaxID=980251 RepID=A0A5B9P8F3_9BACT|nr:acetate kinase [Mariniblastus fucicola]QEG22634.1 Acetate kinase [Mariniblastus fucicola]